MNRPQALIHLETEIQMWTFADLLYACGMQYTAMAVYFEGRRTHFYNRKRHPKLLLWGSS